MAELLLGFGILSDHYEPLVTATGVFPEPVQPRTCGASACGAQGRSLLQQNASTLQTENRGEGPVPFGVFGKRCSKQGFPNRTQTSQNIKVGILSIVSFIVNYDL